jgi:HSP20 family protein
MRLARYREVLPDAGWTRPFEMQSRMQRMLSELMAPQQPEGLGWVPAIDVLETDTEVVIRADLPGMKKDEVLLEIADGTLVIKGEKKEEKEEKKAEYRLIERSWGAFERRFTLPSSVDAEGIRAEFVDGVLEVHMPKTAKAAGRRVEIAAT